MSDQKPTPAERLQGEFNMAAYRYGILDAADLLTKRQDNTLSRIVSDIDVILNAKSKLYYQSSGSENNGLIERLDRPANRLKAEFVRKVHNIIRKLDPQKVEKKARDRLGL